MPCVASLAEAWIEIKDLIVFGKGSKVASLAEAWIEIRMENSRIMRCNVASLAEAWIEIQMAISDYATGCRRFPCGSVD